MTQPTMDGLRALCDEAVTAITVLGLNNPRLSRFDDLLRRLRDASVCGAVEPGTGYECELPAGHGGQHVRCFGEDEQGAIEQRCWPCGACDGTGTHPSGRYCECEGGRALERKERPE